MKKYSKLYKKKLFKEIDVMSHDTSAFVKNPGKDFTRNRKLNFKTMIKYLLTLDGGALKSEFLKIYEFDLNAPTTSAFIQQRKKILPFTFKHLLKKQLGHKKNYKKYKGYRTLAIDGSQLPIPYNPNDKDSYKPIAGKGICVRGCNSLLINALYDLKNNVYLDANIQGLKSMNEKSACEKLIIESTIDEPVILIADRGYEGYSLLCTLDDKNWKYLIRVKDKYSNGMFSQIAPATLEEYDFDIKWDLSYSTKKEIREKLENYRFVRKPNSIKVMERDNLDHYLLNIRVVRVLITENNYETLITNLSAEEFNSEELKELYNQRWGIETSFRKLKYAIGLLHLHSKERTCMEQEIYGKLVMYNYCEMVTVEVLIKQDKQHIHKANFTIAAQVCRAFFGQANNKKPPDVEGVISKNTEPIRPGRVAPRRRQKASGVSFIYRVL